jgi:hypothetical protein
MSGAVDVSRSVKELMDTVHQTADGSDERLNALDHLAHP